MPQTVDDRGVTLQIYDGSGTNAGDILIDTQELSQKEGFIFHCITGAFDVLGCLDAPPGTYNTSPLALQDLGSASSVPVLSGVAGKMYALSGGFQKLRVRQSGATASRVQLRAYNRRAT